jgi:hypothetical protein
MPENVAIAIRSTARAAKAAKRINRDRARVPE